MDPFSLPPVVPAAPPPEVPFVSTQPRRSRRGRVVGALAAVAVLGAGGVVVAKNIQSAEGGFDSPDTAVRALLKAADQEDVLGVIDVMRPGERAMLRDTLVPLEQEMERLDVLTKHVDMHRLPGLQLSVEGVTTTTDDLNDRVAVVTLTGGTMTANASVADLPLGTLLRGKITQPTDPQQPSTAQLSGTRLATVKEDGRWYVSLGYSIAEAARRSAHGPVPDFAHPIPSVGADSPEAAVRGMATAISRLDLVAAIGLLSPGEFGALQDYGTLFVDKAQKAIDSFISDNSVSANITFGTATVDRSGNRATVAFDSIAATVAWSTSSVKIAVDSKGCSTVDSDVNGSKNHQRVCPGDAAAGTVDVPADVKPIVDRLSKLSLRAVAVQEQGHWYVAPIRSLFDLVAQVAGAFSSTTDITAVQKWLGSLLNGAIGGVVGSTDVSGGDVGPTDTTPFDTVPNDNGPVDTGPVDSTGAALPPVLAAFDEAFRAHQQDGEDPANTLAAMLADGSIPTDLVFLDSSGNPVSAGSFAGVIGVEAVVAGEKACMIFGPDSTTPAEFVDCP